MKNTPKLLLLVCSIFIFNLSGKGQVTDSTLNVKKAVFHVYIGIAGEEDIGIGVTDLCLNYEHNILQLPNSYSNLRFGFGTMGTRKDDIGYYLNASFVHLLGKKNHHLELNLGVNYITNIASDGWLITHDQDFYPDLYTGYRFENPDGIFIFRVGISLVTLFNFGLGIKF